MKTTMKLMSFGALAVASCIGCTAIAQETSNTAQQSATSSTAANKADADSSAVTPFSQSNSQDDLKVTQDIRQAIEKENNLSTNARNVKVITTTDHTVYLKGVVDSEDERNRILALAKNLAGSRKLDNFLKLPSETQAASNQ